VPEEAVLTAGEARVEKAAAAEARAEGARTASVRAAVGRGDGVKVEEAGEVVVTVEAATAGGEVGGEVARPAGAV